MFIDSHCHLPHDIKKARELVEKAKKAQVNKIIAIATYLEELEAVLNLANEVDEVYAALGIYPHKNRDMPIEAIITEFTEFLATNPSKKVVAIGECGFDITNWEQQRPLKDQITLFEAQIRIAKRLSLPVVIHNRNGEEHLLNILKNTEFTNQPFVAHCFDSTWAFAKKLLDHNVTLSFSGFITHKSKQYLLETVKNVPSGRFIIETDAPYILPKKLPQNAANGERLQNEPANVTIVARKIAEIREKSLEEIAQETTSTACRIFNIW